MDTKPNPAETCDIILSYVKRSNLNFQLTESPFAVNIAIKKSFIRDKSGLERHPCFDKIAVGMKHENQSLVALNCALETSLYNKDAEMEALKKTISELEMKIENLQVEEKVDLDMELESKLNPNYFFWPSFKTEMPSHPKDAINNHLLHHTKPHYHNVFESFPIIPVPKTSSNHLQSFPMTFPVPSYSPSLSKPPPTPTPPRTPSSSRDALLSPSCTSQGPPPELKTFKASTSPASPGTPASSRATLLSPSFTPPGPPPGFEPLKPVPCSPPGLTTSPTPPGYRTVTTLSSSTQVAEGCEGESAHMPPDTPSASTSLEGIAEIFQCNLNGFLEIFKLSEERLVNRMDEHFKPIREEKK